VFARAFNLHGVITEQGCAGPAATRLSAVPLRDNLALQSEVRRFLAKKGSEAYAIARGPRFVHGSPAPTGTARAGNS
jgi:hypothetical protein